MGEFERIYPVQGPRPILTERSEPLVRRKDDAGTGGQGQHHGKGREDFVELHEEEVEDQSGDVVPDQFERPSGGLDIGA